ncbi:MAG: hypothetical protein CVV23_13910 [Ignavibacteriae bacterium HGW-Ignavibacteriae-2]|jgi:hypothetical protein|nr:DUF4342 domain-containing protein [Bacteroidota bacterium]PKL87711.1 MAG: hypothetical protein CVV23_13910 [Ignavibacteriae bacterium HGW-Ignavibacteriae-2]
MKNEFKVSGKDLLNKIEELIKEGNIRRIIIKDSDGKTFLEIPLTIGVIGVLAAPVVTAIGALAGAVAKFTIEIVKMDDNKKDAEFEDITPKE